MIQSLDHEHGIGDVNSSSRWLMKNFKKLQLDPLPGIITAPQDEDIMIWNAIIYGPHETPWSGGTFKLTLQFPLEYPDKPPRVRFASQMFHPNIYEDGRICLDILEDDQWTPALSRIESVLLSIQSLLSDANPDSPVNSEAARLFSENRREYNRRVREVVEQSQKRL